ncbi:sulfatase-like hydrolase/transferase [Luteolibacter marinus]|uniref:sulfatase-like hydrolase/transferase n=1 Tax=Luteolibacter marinus TaxID=2776705 RepID=UPI0018687EC4|nr:sulfatase-like hydrolase/transferase [Luteolibacter marinus]
MIRTFAILAAGIAAAHGQFTLFSSDFDGNTGAHVFTKDTDNTSGSSTLGVTWNSHASVTGLTGLTAISTGDSGTLGGFARTQGGTGAFADGNNVFLSRNLNQDTNRTTSRRGFSLGFTLGDTWDLGTLTVLSGHTNNSATQDQSYSSDLVFTLSGGSLASPVSSSVRENYGTGSTYHTVPFDLAGTTLGPGSYTLSVYQTNMTEGGAYAIFDGITLEGNNGAPLPPAIASFTASKTYVTAGGSVALSWQTEGADSLAISPAPGDVTASSADGDGTAQVTVEGTTTYTLTANGPGGSSTRTVEVASGPPRPNLVVFLADDYGPQDIAVPFCLDSGGNPVGYNFNAFYQTPHLEALAANGMRFTSAYAQSVCSPTRCGLMTGRNSARHAVTDWVGGGGAGSPANWRTTGINGSDETLPKLLKAGGYRTIHIGKAHFSNAATPVTDLGFDVNVAGFHWGHPHSGYIGSPAYGGMPGMQDYDGSIFLTRALGIEANKALDSAVAEGRPFFLNMSFYATHAPFTTNPDATGDYSAGISAGHRAFATMTEGMDLAIGAIRQKLVDLGVAENTLIVFLGDNGSDSPAVTVDGLPSGTFGDYPLRGKKGSKWEGGCRVPMIAAWAAPDPSNPFQQALPIPANSVETDIVTSWDVPVTLLAASGLPAAPGFGEDGHDLSGYLAATPGFHRPQEITVHYPHVHRSNYFSWIRQENLKLIYNYQSNTHQLYDLAADPTESNDLAAARPETVTRLARRLARDLAATWGERGPLIPTVATTAPNGNVVSIPDNPSVDSDDDGLADVLEDPDLDGLVDSGETDPDNDNTDGDATNDGDETRTGTDPLDATSFFRATPAAVAGSLLISWPSKPGALYRIESSAVMDASPWDEVADDVPAGAGNATTYDLGSPAGNDRMFYRIVIK